MDRLLHRQPTLLGTAPGSKAPRGRQSDIDRPYRHTLADVSAHADDPGRSHGAGHSTVINTVRRPPGPVPATSVHCCSRWV